MLEGLTASAGCSYSKFWLALPSCPTRPLSAIFCGFTTISSETEDLGWDPALLGKSPEPCKSTESVGGASRERMVSTVLST